MATFTLQTMKSGEQPKNQIFNDQKQAYTEAVKAHGSGAFEMVRMFERSTAGQTVLFDSARFKAGTAVKPSAKAAAQAAFRGRGSGAKRSKSNANLSRTVSLAVTLALIGGVVYYVLTQFNH